jgi:hypothetical protein
MALFWIRVFAPPLRPPDLVGGTSGRHDGPLIGRTEYLTEAGQRGLDEPRFEAHPCGLAVGIKFLGHSQRLECRCDATTIVRTMTRGRPRCVLGRSVTSSITARVARAAGPSPWAESSAALLRPRHSCCNSPNAAYEAVLNFQQQRSSRIGLVGRYVVHHLAASISTRKPYRQTAPIAVPGISAGASLRGLPKSFAEGLEGLSRSLRLSPASSRPSGRQKT